VVSKLNSWQPCRLALVKKSGADRQAHTPPEIFVNFL
jgi:hypothetical protein